MSKIKLTGDASGTGTLTIAAPNTDSDYSVTLPEVTGGEFVVSDSSGDVGIGTNSPSSTLHIKAGADSINGGLRLESANGTQYATIDMNNAGNLRFYQNGTSRMRIDSSGNLLVGATSVSASNNPLEVYGDLGAATFRRANLVASPARSMLVFRNESLNTVIGSIACTTNSTSLVTSSDYRLKENVVDMTGSIDRLKQLNPTQFNFIGSPEVTVDGFLAHEVQDIVPEAITGEKDGIQVWEESEELPEGVSVGDAKLDEDGNTIPDYQGIDQSKLVPLLTSALQEAIARIETLEAEVTALKGAE